jgi:hypothetical protein
VNGPLTEPRAIEAFHLAFLAALPTKVPQDRWVVKGGAALRYWFGSLRYSEDIDLDASGIAADVLGERVESLLVGPAVAALLRSVGVTPQDARAVKATNTTRRWKLALLLAGRAEPVRTKVEFSFRRADLDPRSVLEPVPERIAAPYALRPPSARHYSAAAATEQKVGALAGRAEPQARDVFDLELLLRGWPAGLAPGRIPTRILDLAIERAFELPYSAFRAQVGPFLEDAVRQIHDTPDTWAATQSYVGERLLTLRSTGAASALEREARDDVDLDADEDQT